MASKISVDLPGGLKMPALGYGTWQATDEVLAEALEVALEAGYRHIDTASAYQNEHVIGKVLKKWITSGRLTREDLFIVTKLPPHANRAEDVERTIKKSLESLQLDYLDLYLIHMPMAFKNVKEELIPIGPDGLIELDVTTDHLATWKAMEAQVDAGRTKSIGISNFNIGQIERIFDKARIRPANLQVELHAYCQQKKLVDFCKKRRISVTAYSPLGNPGMNAFASKLGHTVDLPDIMGNPVVAAIAKKRGKTTAQVLLRHIVQRGIAAIPKSTTSARIRENIDIFDFELDENDMAQMNGLDMGDVGRIVDFGFLSGCNRHPEYPF